MGSDSADFETLGFLTREASEFPIIVNAEVYRSQCPCECRHCPVGRTPPARRTARFGEMGMRLWLYGKIVDEISQYPGRMLRVHSVGEPLLWKDLAVALEMSRRKGVPTWIFTCAVTHNRPLLEAVCENADIVEISLNSTNGSDYLATKGVDAFELVVENLNFLRGLVDRGAATRLIVSRVQSTDRAADEAFISHWKGTGMVHDAFVRTYHTYNDLLAELPGGDGDAHRHEPCLVHWARFNIGVRGQAVVCFNELFKERLDQSLVLGDVNRQPIAEIWHGPAMAALRKAELSGDYSALPFASALPCRDCRSCQPLHGSGPTSEHQIDFLQRR